MLQFNSADLKDALFNGNSVQQILFGGNVVWQRVEGIRYIRDWLKGSETTSDPGNYWSEIKAFVGNTNVALGKSVTSDRPLHSVSGPISIITDGYVDTYTIENEKVRIWSNKTVDLGALFPIDKIMIWHLSNYPWYFTNKTEVSADGINWKTVFDSAVSGTYQETPEGHTINLT